MRAVVVDEFGSAPRVAEVPDPRPPVHGVVVEVAATGVCRSDWHAWQGHDPDVTLPHVPGHELAGTVVAVGRDVRRFRVGDRVTTPFVTACGTCPECAAGQHQVCRAQTQPGFTGWGSFATLVALDHADVNLVALADLPATEAAALGCRVATAFRAVTDVGAVRAGEWVAVHGCGGVGLSAVMVAAAAGARVVAVDVRAGALDLATAAGAEVVVRVDRDQEPLDVAARVRGAADGPVALSLDALGSPATCAASLGCLAPRGRHVQVGLLPDVLGWPAVPLHLVIAGELELLGSHGMAAWRYPELLGLVAAGRLRPGELVTARVPLDDAGAALAAMGDAPPTGIVVALP